jgi:tetratricopeptide (TPR) repeat protein
VFRRLFGRRPRITADSIEQALAEGRELLSAGQTMEAEAHLRKTVEAAAAQHGEDHPIYAHSLSRMASLLGSMGDFPRAAEFLRRASEVPSLDDESEKDRLSYLLSLGHVLAELDRLDESEFVLREGLNARLDFYGENHPGYAFGLSGLAETLLKQDRTSAAAAAIDEAVAINWEAGQEEVASDLALRAFIVKADRGFTAPALENWNDAPKTLQQAIVLEVINRADAAPAEIAQAVLLELRSRLQQTPDVEVPDLLNANIAIANAAQQTEDFDVRIEAAEMASRLAGGLDNLSVKINIAEGVAHAYSQAGREAEAEQSYLRAMKLAAADVTGELRVGVLRNFAIWSDEQQLSDRAEELHLEAVRLAEQTNNRELIGRCCVARGIFLQHAGRLDEARPLLERSLDLLPPSHEDAASAMSHYEAMKGGGECGCDEDPLTTFGQVITRQVHSMIGDDILESVVFERGEDGLRPNVLLKVDDPTDEQMEQIHTAISQALAMIRYP